MTTSAATIRTDTEGLVAGPIAIPAGDRSIPGYHARPAGTGKAPLVLVVCEIFGVREYVCDVARRFAKLGYFAVAPEMFVRQGDAHAVDDVDTLLRTIVSKAPDAQAMADLDAAVAWAARVGADASRLGITGFCWGGRISWLYAAHNPALKAAIAWYGRLVGASNALQTSFPVDVAAALQAPVLGLYGGKDQSIPLDTVETMRQALAKGSEAARQSRIHVYPEANHAFHADYRPNYDRAAAEDGWKRCVDWLRGHGVA